MQVGAIEVLPVHDLSLRIDPGLLFPRTAEQWGPHRRYLADDGKLTLDFGGFLIRSADRCVLVDLGLGPGSPAGQGHLLDSLAGIGVGKSEVTDVVLTHLHADHIGWASDDTSATFPNATYHCDERDWEFFVAPNAAFEGHGPEDPSPQRIKNKMAAVENRVELWSSDTTVAPGISVRRTPGHTPGSSIVVVSDGDDRAVLLGDVCHCPAELLENDWAALADVDTEMAQRTREALARELEGSGVAIAAAHFPGLQFGRLLAGTGKRSWVFDGVR